MILPTCSEAPFGPESIAHALSLETGRWHWRDQLAASLPRSGLGRSFSFRSLLPHVRTKRGNARNASLAGIGGSTALIEWLADGLREEHDEAAEPKTASAGCYGSEQKMAVNGYRKLAPDGSAGGVLQSGRRFLARNPTAQVNNTGFAVAVAPTPTSRPDSPFSGARPRAQF